MKKEHVPQDDENLAEGEKEIAYAVDENGNYVAVSSAGWAVKNTVMKYNWECINQEVEFARQEVEEGKFSPIHYHMKKNLMDLQLVAEYAGIPKRKVKKHLKPKNFQKLTSDELEKYVKAFKLNSEEELINLPEGESDEN
jgi:hypothetical protein